MYRSDTSKPINKAQVMLYPSDPETATAAGGKRIVRTSADGAFVFPDLPPGTYGLEVSRNGFSEFSWQQEEQNKGRFITLGPGQTLENLSLRLRPTGVIEGQVSDEDQEAVSGVEVFALRISFLPGRRKQVSAAGRISTDDLGSFRLANCRQVLTT